MYDYIEPETRENPMNRKVIIGSVLSKVGLLGLSVVVLWLGLSMLPSSAVAEETGAAAVAQADSATQALGMKYIAAAVSVGLGSIAGGIAVAVVGSAAMGAVAERPELMGRSLIYVGLAEGIAIYGMVVAIMILIQ
jgi:V/A-type H+-transporting ATPase subunit K